MIFTFFSLLKPYEEDDGVIEFNLTLCFDVILEVLQFGDRRRLTKLEEIGRRFHYLVEKWFGELSFLRLDIQFEPGCLFVRHKLKFIICDLFLVKGWRLLLVGIGKRFRFQIW